MFSKASGVCVCVRVCVCVWVGVWVCVCVSLRVPVVWQAASRSMCVCVCVIYAIIFFVFFIEGIRFSLVFFLDFGRFRDFQDVLEGPWGSRGGPRGAHKQMLFFGGFLGWVPGGTWGVFGGMGRSLGQP